jgi:hypothetical protein
MIAITLKPTMPMNVTTIGIIARFSMVDSRLFQWVEADKISEALSSAMRHTTIITLISDTPTVANMLTTDDVVLAALSVLVVLSVLLTVLNIDDNKLYSSLPGLSTLQLWCFLSDKL